MEMKKNVVAAIATAVQMYLATEPVAPMVEVTPRVVEPPRQALSLWAVSGRQSAMEMRRLWQLRLVR